MMCLLLWDVDHTLIENGGVSKEIYSAAFERLTSQPAVHPAQTGGRTDPEIMRGMLDAHDFDPSKYDAGELFVALEAAGRDKATDLRARGHALPGAVDALRLLHSEPSVLQSVLTGNIKANAFVKLAAFELDSYMDFDIGGFGSDDNVRANLVGVAQRRAESKFGRREEGWATILVGDTPRDVEAGVRGGAHVLGVATGATTQEELLEAGADEMLPGLEDTTAVVEAVRRLGDQGARITAQ
jgi:phosphoglycolate phosphatase-like HAD superfamily hydrolase